MSRTANGDGWRRPGTRPADAHGGPDSRRPRALAAQVRHKLSVEGRAATPAAVVTALRTQAATAVLGDGAVLRLAESVHRDLVGAGPLATLLADPDVTDVLVNRCEVWADRGRGLQRVPITLDGPDEVRRLAQRLAAACGRRLDDGEPFADARLPDGTRLHAALPPVAADGPYLSLRTFRHRPFTLSDLVSQGTVAPEAADLLAATVRARLAYLVVGGTGSGKTTLLNTLLGAVPPTERVVIVEDAVELHPAHPHVVRLQARTANVEGAGVVSQRDLIRQALRMRPDRLVVGECRGAEILDLLGALNTGHDGGAATLHANSPEDVPARLEALGLLGGLSRAALHAQVVAALQAVIHIRRTPQGRLVDSLGLVRPVGADAVATVVPVWSRQRGAGPAMSRFRDLTGHPPADAHEPGAARATSPAGLRGSPGPGRARCDVGVSAAGARAPSGGDPRRIADPARTTAAAAAYVPPS